MSTKYSTIQDLTLHTKSSFIKLVLDMSKTDFDKMIDTLQSAQLIKTNEGRYKIEDGLWIYRYASNSRNWYVHVVIQKNDKKIEEKKTLSTEDFNEAVKRAIRKKIELEALAKAGVIEDKNESLFFSNIAKTVIDDFDKAIKKAGGKRIAESDYKSILVNHVIPYFKNKSIKKIDLIDIEEYLNQLGNKSKTTLTKQKTAIKKVFEKAVRLRLIKDIEVPIFKSVNVKHDDSERITEPFSEYDLNVFKNNYQSFIDSATKEKSKHYRQAFQYYFSFLLATGVRPGEEPLNIKYGDIEKRKDKKTGQVFYVIKITAGKTQSKNKARLIAVDTTAIKAIEAVSKILINDENRSIDELIKQFSDHYIFKSYVYDAFPTYADIFRKEQLLGFVAYKLKYKDYVLYSCRTTYINNKIADGIPLNDIADHCGNSVQTIEKYYKKATLMNSAPAHIKADIVDYDFEKDVKESAHEAADYFKNGPNLNISGTYVK
jgi:integrase